MAKCVLGSEIHLGQFRKWWKYLSSVSVNNLLSVTDFLERNLMPQIIIFELILLIVMLFD